MLKPSASTLLVGLLALPSAVRAVFPDEVGHIDYHYTLLGLPQRETTFFHRPRKEEKASLLYTLSDEGVLGAVNPGSGGVVWRQQLTTATTTETDREHVGFARAGEGEGWVVSAYGGKVQAWDAITGRNKFSAGFKGEVVDLEVMELTEAGRKDVLALFEQGEETVLRRLSAVDGKVVWEFREAITGERPLQVSTNVQKVFVVSLRGAGDNLKVTALDTLTGKRSDVVVIGTKTDAVAAKEDVMFVGANSAAPVVAWLDAAKKTLRVNVLGLSTRQEFALPEGAVSVEIHAPHLVQSQPHFLVHSRTETGNQAEVFHIDLKTGHVEKAYGLPLLPGPGAFSTSSSGANVYFTRITEDEVLLVSSQSHGVLGRWPLKGGKTKAAALHAVAEVVKKAGATDSFSVRAAAVTSDDEWALVTNGEVGWVRPEGLSGGVAAAFAEIPESEELARSLEQEAHSNPLEAYIHRLKRHIHDLQYLPAWLSSIPERVVSSLTGADVASTAGKLTRDSFGFHKLVILATKRGMVYGLDAGNFGTAVWNTRAVEVPKGSTWEVRGIQVHEPSAQVEILGASDDRVVLKSDTGDIIEAKVPGSEATTQSTVIVDTQSGQHLLRIGPDGKMADLPIDQAPKQTIVTRGANGELKGVIFVPHGSVASESTSWTFSLPKSQRIVSIAARPAHDAVASIGRVLGDRTVKYKYLNPNTIVVAAVDDKARILTIYLLDTVSGDILHSAKYTGVDTTKPVECAMAENWFVCSFFGQYSLRENVGQSVRGYQIIVSDLYESEEANDRGPLGDSDTFSPLDPIDTPTGVVLPSVVSQTYILGAPISALQVSQTRQGITSRQLLAYLPETHGIVGIPRILLEPRRVVGRDPTAAEMEEGLIKYHPAIEIDPKSVITHERDVLGIKKIITSPAVVESTSLVFAYGVDVFGTRVSPSFLFDILGKGFNKVSLVGTVLAILAGVVVLAPMVRRKQIDLRWSAPM